MHALMARIRWGLLGVPEREVDPERRGFAEWEAGPSRCEDVGRSFLTGYRAGLVEPGAVSAVRSLADLDDDLRGFAMEGLGMAAALRDVLRPGGRHFRDLLACAGERHVYMIHVGLGWALARTPRPLWPSLSRLDPVHAALVLDGYGFHEVFFRTRRVFDELGVGFPLSAWPGRPQDAHQHLMQGVGRGLWFVAGGGPARLADYVGRFAPSAAGSLWAGVGLAAAYAGGRDEAGLRELRATSGEYSPWLRQGATFAVGARDRAGASVEHTHLAARVLCDGTVETVHALARAHLPRSGVVDAGDWSAAARWRCEVAGYYATHAPDRDGHDGHDGHEPVDRDVDAVGARLVGAR
ncbi:hypothetical protein JCM9957A_22960 [Kineosporia succinea]